jgi:hypothetical protein
MADPGVRTTDTMAVPIANEPRRAAILREVTAHPSVFAVAAKGPPTQAEASVFAEATADRQAGDSGDMRRSVSIEYKFVSPEYFQLLDIDLTRGRGFTDAQRTADAQFFAFSGVCLPIDPQRPGTLLLLRVRGDPERARVAVLDRLLRVDRPHRAGQPVAAGVAKIRMPDRGHCVVDTFAAPAQLYTSRQRNIGSADFSAFEGCGAPGRSIEPETSCRQQSGNGID